jgi:putative hydrolase
VSAATTRNFNHAAGALLRQCATLLREQNANPFRANAYLKAAETLESLSVDARELLRTRGLEGLTELPAIGSGIAGAIAEIATTGRLARLERLRGNSDPETLLRSVPGIGPALAHRLHAELHANTLEALEIAAHDGRLEALPGVGPRRAAAIRANLEALLRRVGMARQPALDGAPSIADLLDVDRQYRHEAAAGALPTIAPRRFNPEHRAWLPVLHTERHGWHFTALYSNTAQAHKLGKTHDWVVVYFYSDDHREAQRTVVTETRGPLAGRRVVRGSERSCEQHYAAHEAEHEALSA